MALRAIYPFSLMRQQSRNSTAMVQAERTGVFLWSGGRQFGIGCAALKALY